MQIPSREHESRTIPARFAALFAAIALALYCTLPLAACEGGSFSGAQTSNPAAVQIADIPEYSGALCIDVNNSEPGFTDDDFKRGAFMEFSDLDFEGRCGAAFARIGIDTLSNAPRGDISQVHPSGWEQHRYDFVDQEMLYNRSHLIAHQLCGEDANEKNLITGTRTMNSVGMTYYESIVANYVKQTGNHVLYRVTPIFAANDLVARGVQMEAESVEDDGQAVRFNVFVYNVEPGVEIDYVTGKSRESSDVPHVATGGEATTTSAGTAPNATGKEASGASTKSPNGNARSESTNNTTSKGDAEKRPIQPGKQRNRFERRNESQQRRGFRRRLGHLIWVARIRAQHQEHEISPPNLLFGRRHSRQQQTGGHSHARRAYFGRLFALQTV